VSATTGAIVRKGGISRTIFIISLVIVASASGVSGYVISGILHPSSSTGTITLNGSGSTFVNPLLQAIGLNYTKGNPTVQINYQPVGSTAGITAVTQKTTDFGASDAPLTSSQLQAAPTLVTIPDTIGAVVIAYNIPINVTYSIHKGLFLNSTLSAMIFQGDITNWNDSRLIPVIRNNPNIPPGVYLPNQPITVVHRGDGSGTTFVFSGYLLSSGVWRGPQSKSVASQYWAPGALGPNGNQGVASYIQGHAFTVGYVELDYALAAIPPMSYAFLFNPNAAPGSNYIEPTLSSTSLAASSISSSYLPAGNGNWTSVSLLNSSNPGAYPIVTFSYIMIYQELNIYGSTMNQARAQALVNYLWFVVHGGQAQAAPLSYVALTSVVVANAEATLRTITYNGSILHS
jgi:phosphate transport system substrate-binding protein